MIEKYGAGDIIFKKGTTTFDVENKKMGKHCPYCGRRISYFTTFHEKKRGIHTCTRCKRESKIKTDIRLMLAFLAVVLIVLIFMVVWNGSQNYNNFMGVIIAALILIAFYFTTPFFIRFVPLKKYRHHETAREEFEYEYEPLPDEDDMDANKDFTFNRDIFDKIKEKRHSTIVRNNAENSDNLGDTKIADKNYVPIIKDVSEAHASSSDKPLKKVTTPNYNYSQYIERDNFDDEMPVRPANRQKQKPDGTKYTANRKF